MRLFLLLCFNAILSFSVLTPFALSKEPKSIPAVKADAPPVIDGVLDDVCWKSAPKATGFDDALLGTPAKDQTVAYLLYDETNIYVGIYCYDSQPDKIVGRQTKEGARIGGEDLVAFSIDTFHNHKFADRSFFIVNPLGTKFARIGGGRAVKTEWQGEWRAAARIVDDGWTVEMVIPFSILSYPSKKEPATVGINFDRGQYRTGVHSWWSNVGPQEFLELDGHWVGVEFPKQKRQLSLLPYLYGGRERQGAKDWSLQGGVDMKYPLTPSLTAVGTVKPDFTNVEQAVESIDFSYGERYVPDRRPFFQEGSDVYSSGSSVGRFIHTRRIPEVDIGMNLYGKLMANTTLGILDVLQRKESNYLIIRGRQEFSATSSVDATFIDHRIEEETNQVLVLGEGYRWRQLSVNASFAQSWVNGTAKGATGNAMLFYQGRRFFLGTVPFFVAPSFQDNVGYFPFTDYRGMTVMGQYTTEWRSGIFRRGSIFARGQYSNHYDGTLFLRTGTVFARIETHSDYQLSLSWDGGRFEEHKRDGIVEIGFGGRVSDRFTNYGVRFSFGQRESSSIKFLNPTASVQIGSLTVGIESQFLWHRKNQQQHILTMAYDITPKYGLGGRLIYRDGSTNFYLAFRRSGYAGVETYVIFGDANAEKFQKRLIAKVIVPL